MKIKATAFIISTFYITISCHIVLAQEKEPIPQFIQPGTPAYQQGMTTEQRQETYQNTIFETNGIIIEAGQIALLTKDPKFQKFAFALENQYSLDQLLPKIATHTTREKVGIQIIGDELRITSFFSSLRKEEIRINGNNGTALLIQNRGNQSKILFAGILENAPVLSNIKNGTQSAQIVGKSVVFDNIKYNIIAPRATVLTLLQELRSARNAILAQTATIKIVDLYARKLQYSTSRAYGNTTRIEQTVQTLLAFAALSKDPQVQQHALEVLKIPTTSPKLDTVLDTLLSEAQNNQYTDIRIAALQAGTHYLVAPIYVNSDIDNALQGFLSLLLNNKKMGLWLEYADKTYLTTLQSKVATLSTNGPLQYHNDANTLLTKVDSILSSRAIPLPIDQPIERVQIAQEESKFFPIGEPAKLQGTMQLGHIQNVQGETKTLVLNVVTANSKGEQRKAMRTLSLFDKDSPTFQIRMNTLAEIVKDEQQTPETRHIALQTLSYYMDENKTAQMTILDILTSDENMMDWFYHETVISIVMLVRSKLNQIEQKISQKRTKTQDDNIIIRTIREIRTYMDQSLSQRGR